jgi:hypothetical protein
MNRARLGAILARGALLALCAWLVVSFVWVVVQRLRFPVEVEWMGGGVLDVVERVKRGESVYVAPSASYVPLIYTPLYFWVAGLVAHVTSAFVACRLVSIVATVANAALVFGLARALGASRFWSVVAVGLFFGGYSLTGYWYDIERCDSLATTLALGGAFAWARLRGRGGEVVAGAIFAFAFLAKQQSLAFVVWPAATLAFTRQWRTLGRFSAGAAVGAVPIAAYAVKNPWFLRYCVGVPSHHGIDIDLLTGLLVDDFGKGFLLFAVTVAVLGVWAARTWRARRGGTEDLVPGAVLFAAFAGAATSRLHVGGWSNVLISWVGFACVAAAVVLGRVEEELGEAGFLLPAQLGVTLLAATQLMHLAYDPKPVCPDRQRVVDAGLFENAVRGWEKRGDVVVPGRGHVTTHRHFHAMALFDILRGGMPLPPDFVAGIEQRKYAAYVVDEFGELTLEGILGHRSRLFGLIERNYFLGKRLDDRERPPVIGWIAHPSWVFFPRKHPLGPIGDPALERRMRIEMGIAEARMRRVQAGVPPKDDDDVIEDEAAAVDRAPPAR